MQQSQFCDKELPEKGRNHNLALHISMNCKDDALSNVLVDTSSSLNVLPKSTLSRLSYQGAPMSYNDVIIKSFDGSRKTVIGEVNITVKIGPSDFQITFQVMDIHPTYSCLLGRPWIHEAEEVTSTLHQKLKFIKNGKLVIVGGEKTLLVSHLSSFSYVKVEDEVGTPFQILYIAEEKRVRALMSSFKDAQKIVEDGQSDQWGQMVEVSDNKSRTSLGFQRGSFEIRSENVQPSFRSGGFIHGNEQHLAAVIEGDEDEDCTNFVTHRRACNNWTSVDISVIMHCSKLISKPIGDNDPNPSPNFEFPVFETEEESDEEIALVNLGSEDDVKEVKIGFRMCPDVKKGLIDLLREYSDVFAWSYQDMPGSDS
ncbi:hypothetical protein KIW84_013172 [Lathyrus oleraceus]|uniref:Uncharacterized protein n=1 Tax=Pisum sativum TaxID=3888 RepID=A0A9D5BJK5_PEA|nr:hypothetical protein KIW84_013172 [Pisum sativum]